jgi:hypothetical protein
MTKHLYARGYNVLSNTTDLAHFRSCFRSLITALPVASVTGCIEKSTSSSSILSHRPTLSRDLTTNMAPVNGDKSSKMHSKVVRVVLIEPPEPGSMYF